MARINRRVRGESRGRGFRGGAGNVGAGGGVVRGRGFRGRAGNVGAGGVVRGRGFRGGAGRGGAVRVGAGNVEAGGVYRGRGFRGGAGRGWVGDVGAGGVVRGRGFRGGAVDIGVGNVGAGRGGLGDVGAGGSGVDRAGVVVRGRGFRRGAGDGGASRGANSTSHQFNIRHDVKESAKHLANFSEARILGNRSLELNFVRKLSNLGKIWVTNLDQVNDFIDLVNSHGFAGKMSIPRFIGHESQKRVYGYATEGGLLSPSRVDLVE